MRIFGEEKHSLEFIVGAGSVLDQALVEQVLKPGFKENAWHYTQGKLGRFKRTYELFVQHILTGSGVQLSAAESFDGMQYKPIQSLFNKLYVRRGQAAMNIIGDHICSAARCWSTRPSSSTPSSDSSASRTSQTSRARFTRQPT